MKKARQNGFVLILVIVALSLIGIYMFVLTGDMNTILFQTNSACLETSRENLVASGLAWSEKNVKGQNKDAFGGKVVLDVNEMNISGAALCVTIQRERAKETEVQINTSCSRGRHIINYEGKHLIELKP
jgi:hypothetical protein